MFWLKIAYLYRKGKRKTKEVSIRSLFLAFPRIKGSGRDVHATVLSIAGIAGFDTCTAMNAVRCKCMDERASPYSTSLLQPK